MGITLDEAILQIRHRYQIYEVAANRMVDNSSDNGTNICASIVPMRDNLDELRSLIHHAIMTGVYPLIGELEEAGYCTGAVYKRQRLSESELQELKSWIRETYEWDYQLPICPATFGAIHINNRNCITVDRFTGAGCHWFDMDDPDPFDLGDFRCRDYRKIANEILDYRLERIEKVRQEIDEYPDMVFGGCGGNARPLLRQYVASYDAWHASQFADSP